MRKKTRRMRKKTARVRLTVAAVLAVAVAGVLAIAGRAGGGASAAHRPGESVAAERGIDRTVGALFAGIPQEGALLGARSAPVTMEVILDLEDPTCRWWFREDLPRIVLDYVRTGALRLRYHAFKRNTYWPWVFVKQQTAALAAGAQGRLWNFIDTFFYEQGEEVSPYVTERYLDGIASQVSGLDLARWHADRHTGRREEQTAAESQSAEALGFRVTPAFRIGRTGGPMNAFMGRTVVQYTGQAHPFALIEAADVAGAIEQLRHNRQLSPASPVTPQIRSTSDRLK
jgi:protein-disulfide isomerase